MVVIANDKAEADQTKKNVEAQEKEATTQAAAAKAIAEDAQARLLAPWHNATEPAALLLGY